MGVAIVGAQHVLGAAYEALDPACLLPPSLVGIVRQGTILPRHVAKRDEVFEGRDMVRRQGQTRVDGPRTLEGRCEVTV